MKKMVRQRLGIVILIAMLLSLALNYYLQIQGARDEMYQSAQDKFSQIEGILQQNEEDIAQLEEDLKEDYFIRAKAAAYIVQNHPEVVENLSEMKKIAKLLQIDEFHLFDPEGNLYAGSEPKYYGMNFNSGEQMQFFLPMLEDHSLQLCQDITPNTAEQKLMQYVAVWMENGENIVQIGLEPVRLLEAMKKNELSYIFSMLTAEKGSAIYAVDPQSFEILGSTKENLVGEDMEAVGLEKKQVTALSKGFSAQVDNENSYCIFRDAGTVLLGVVRTKEVLYQDIRSNMLLVAVFLAALAIVVFKAIFGYIDQYIVGGISKINEKLGKITGGNLDTAVEVTSTPEFAMLSEQINRMVKSLLDTTNKFSQILESAQVSMGVFEYNQDMKRVMATSRVKDILRLSDEEAEQLFADYSLFEERVAAIRALPVEQEKNIYRISPTGELYVKIETFATDSGIMGMVVDVTEDILEKRQLEHERDYDLLTDLNSRRAFYSKMDQLFENPREIGVGILLMADVDNLKQINDQYGHLNGDLYLKGVADALCSCEALGKITARLSGDEFVLFLYGDPIEVLEGHVAALQRKMNDSYVELKNGCKVQVQFSAGYACYPTDEEDYHRLLNLSDSALYQAKKRGKGTFIKYSQEL